MDFVKQELQQHKHPEQWKTDKSIAVSVNCIYVSDINYLMFYSFLQSVPVTFTQNQISSKFSFLLSREAQLI